MMRKIHLHELEAAINAARTAAPATGTESRLSADVDAMAMIYGELIFSRHSAFELDSIDSPAQNILTRWLKQSSGFVAK